MTATDRTTVEAATETTAGRRALMAALANASADEIASGLALVGNDREAKELRRPETGLVMLRGRVGGDGAPFNVGEATVTRAAVELSSGERGFSYVLGRDGRKARLAALCDALWQSDAHRAAVMKHVLAPLQNMQREKRTKAQAETAATRVDFFTLVRGEDPT